MRLTGTQPVGPARFMPEQYEQLTDGAPVFETYWHSMRVPALPPAGSKRRRQRQQQGPLAADLDRLELGGSGASSGTSMRVSCDAHAGRGTYAGACCRGGDVGLCHHHRQRRWRGRRRRRRRTHLRAQRIVWRRKTLLRLACWTLAMAAIDLLLAAECGLDDCCWISQFMRMRADRG
jgi:hypothetical protein